MRHRTQKQIVIGTIFCSFWVGVIALAVWVMREPPLPPPPPTRTFQALETSGVTILRSSTSRGDLVALLKNPNADAGARRVRYAFVLPGNEGNPVRIPGETFLMPGRQKYIAALSTDLPETVNAAELVIDHVDWQEVRQGFVPPSLVLVNRTTRMLPGEPELFEVKGTLANEADVDFLRAEVTVVGLNAAGDVVGMSKTFVGSLLARERREFTAQWPLPRGEEVVTVVALPDVNIFLADAVLERSGALDVQDAPGSLPSP